MADLELDIEGLLEKTRDYLRDQEDRAGVRLLGEVELALEILASDDEDNDEIDTPYDDEDEDDEEDDEEGGDDEEDDEGEPYEELEDGEAADEKD